MNVTHEAPGTTLIAARESRNLSREDIAAELNLLVSQVKALESNDYGCFNAELFVKGFMRSYADLLDLDAEPLVADAQRHMHTLEPKKPRREAPRQQRSRDAFLRVVFAGVAAGVLWMLAVALFGN